MREPTDKSALFLESLDKAFDSYDRDGLVPPSSNAKPDLAESVATAVAELRIALALRGRTDPNRLIDESLTSSGRLEVLDYVARDCDAGRNGHWLLNDAARRREFEFRGTDEISSLLVSIEDGDETTQALRTVFLGRAEPEALPASRLRSLLAIEPSVLGIAPGYPDAAEVRRQLAYRSRFEELVRFTGNGIVGRKIELAELMRFARSETSSKFRIASFLLWGTGGIGKSTLVSSALAELLRERHSALVPVHLDFDRRELTIEDTVGLSLELLRQIGTIDPEADRRLKDVRDKLREFLRVSFDTRQRGGSESRAASVLSLMRGCLAFLRSPARRIVLVLDTFENVETAGMSALLGLRRWIEQLALVSGAPQIRLVVAGRSDPAVNGATKALGWNKPTIRELKDLSRDEACELLTEGGVPRASAEAIFGALGGNPLVLSLIRRMFETTRSLQEIESVAADVKQGFVPAEILQGVLYDRFLKHVQSEDARAYAHPGLVLPEITPDLIRRVLGPLKGEPGMSIGRSREICDAIASATWLVNRRGNTLSQRPDVRRLMLTLMTADPKRSAEVYRVRLAAILHHSRSNSVSDRAALAYHLLMQVKDKEDLGLFDGIDLSGTGPTIRRMAGDLPEIARTFVEVLDFESGPGRNRRAVAARSIPAQQALTELPDDLWYSFMAGDASRQGEGDRLVDHGDPSAALSLWRQRPAGSKGKPPTFVLRALADTGEWTEDGANIAALTDEIGKLPSGLDLGHPRADERLYWTTRYALLARPFGFSRENSEFRPLVKLLKRFHERRPKSTMAGELVALSAIVEGLCEEKIIPERMFASGSPYASCTRLHLQRGRWSGRVIEWHLELAALVTLQKNFAASFSNRSQDVLRAGSQVVFQSHATAATANMLKALQAEIDSLHGKPLDRAERLGDLTKRKVTVRAGRHEGADRALEVRLLRGQTPELHRAARQALVEGLLEDRHSTQTNRSAKERVADFASEAFKLMTVRPSDFNPRRFAARASADPQTTFLTFVQFADRARVLESVLLVARNHAIDDGKIMRVLSAWRAWDWALARQSADWTGGFVDQR